MKLASGLENLVIQKLVKETADCTYCALPLSCHREKAFGRWASIAVIVSFFSLLLDFSVSMNKPYSVWAVVRPAFRPAIRIILNTFPSVCNFWTG